ncbi:MULTISPECIES: hypothetical protein [Herpetosiphon]|uniref:hypothetical protein n=1 Tax=Herpetosiphon TaxID=64 RepID=UPI001364DE22|nr:MULTISPECIES: hypothetical protein [Herpetosiphon]MBM7842259.1 hypothetical protein [Herpetosiphon giganteus]
MSKGFRNWLIIYAVLFLVLVVGMMFLDVPWYVAVILTAVGMIYQAGRYFLWD